MRFNVMAKLFVLLFFTTAMLLLSSCTRMGGPILFNDDGQKSDSTFEQVIQAFKDKDKDALKAMFSEQALSDAEDLDGRIDYVFDFVQGDIISEEQGSSVVTDDVDTNGQRVKISLSRYSVKTDQEEYQFALREYVVDTAHPENVGLYMLQVIKMEDVDMQFKEIYNNFAGIYKPDEA